LVSESGSSHNMSCCPADAAPYLAPDHTDEGTVRSIDGICFYQVGTGPVGLLICPDIWGWNGGRTRAIADDFAKKGLSVWVPKVLPPFEGGTDGDGLPPTFNNQERGKELGPLLGGDWHAAKSVPKAEKVIGCMKKAGIKKMAALGFCYGGWLAMRLMQDAKVKFVCCASPHPSIHIEAMLGGDVAELAKASNCPWALFPCGVAGDGGDGDIYDKGGAMFEELEKKFPGKNVTKRYSKQKHGFVPRGAIKPTEHNAGTGDEVKASVVECLDDITKFFQANKLFPKPAGAPPPLKRPKMHRVGKIVPDATGLNLGVKCVKMEERLGDDGKTKMYMATMGDATGIVTFDLRSADQAALCTPGASIRIQNCKVRMTKGHIQVVCDKWCAFRAAEEPYDFEVKEDKNVSETEYVLKP